MTTKIDDGYVSVYGNCQADSLLRVLLQSPSFKARFQPAAIPPCFIVSAAQMRVWAETKAAEVRVLIHQKLRANWRNDEVFDTQWLRAQAAAATLVMDWSDMYYRAWEPHMVYPVTMPRIPPSDYINLLHVLVHVHGLPWQRVMEFYTDPGIFPGQLVSGMHGSSIMTLAERENECAIRISSYLHDHWRQRRLFQTFNHPSRPVMLHAARQVLSRLGIDDDLPETGAYAFPDSSGQALLASINALSAAQERRHEDALFTLGGKAITARDYFESWEASLARVPTEKWRAELAQHVRDQVFAGPLLAIAARHLGVAEPS